MITRLGILGCSALLLLAACGGSGGRDGSEGGGVVPAVGGFGGALGDETFTVVLLVSEDDAPSIDAVAVSCAANGVLNNLFTVGEDVALEGGEFTAESDDVEIVGTFTSADQAEGTVNGLSDGAIQCGIPEDGDWVAERGMTVEVEPSKDGDSGGIVVGNSFTTADNGSRFSYLSIALEDGSWIRATADGGENPQ